MLWESAALWVQRDCMSIGFIVSSIIFAITFGLIISERVHRTVIALIGAVSMVVAGLFLDFYHPDEAIATIDFNTIGLLFGMMIIVAILEHTGAFQYLGVWVAKKTKGRPWPLIVSLGALTAVLSMILDNVTTIILIVPITIIVARMVSISPLPLLMAEAILSNVGGVATLVGDPPNIMIGSVAGFSFIDFLTHSLPVVVVVWAVTLVMLRFAYRKEIRQEPQDIDKLETMDETAAISDWRTLKVMIAVLALVVLLFFLHHLLHMPPALVAVIGAALALLLTAPSRDPQKVLEKTELSVLLFFAALFVLVGGLEHAGVLEYLAHFITSGAQGNMLITALIVLWGSAILSAIVDNIPFTVAMLPVIAYLDTSGLSVDLLWWALVFGVGFGGNITPIGSSAGVIVTSKSQETGAPISFWQWFKTGAPLTLAGLVCTSAALVAFQSFFS